LVKDNLALETVLILCRKFHETHGELFTIGMKADANEE